jgi:hypothetical protein
MSKLSSGSTDIERLTSAVEDFCVWIESLPARETRAQEWGPREVLAHLVYWHEHYVAESRAFLAGKLLPLPGGRFSELNANAVVKFQSTPIPRLTERFQLANRRLCRLVNGPDGRKIAFSIKQGSKRWRLSELIPLVEAHIRNHKKSLVQSIRRSAD